jgi:hypothetical protein
MAGETCAHPDRLQVSAGVFRVLGGEVDDGSEVDAGAVDVLEALLARDVVEATRHVVDQVRRAGDAVGAGLGVVATDLDAWARSFANADS